MKSEGPEEIGHEDIWTEYSRKRKPHVQKPQGTNVTRVQRTDRRPVWLKRQNSRRECQKHGGAGGTNKGHGLWDHGEDSGIEHSSTLVWGIFLDAELRAQGATTAGLWNKGSQLACSHTNDNLTTIHRQKWELEAFVGTQGPWEVTEKPW